MKFSLNEQELLHLVGVLKNDLTERGKNIRRVNFDTSEEILENRIISYNRTKDLLQRVEEWYKMVVETHVRDDTPVVGDDDLYHV